VLDVRVMPPIILPLAAHEAQLLLQMVQDALLLMLKLQLRP
jgi:hypothetical protein